MCDSDKNVIDYYGTTTYKKGAFIGYHLSNLFGKDVFREAISLLFKEHLWGVINSWILFETFEKVLKARNRADEIDMLKRFRDEFIMETNGPTITMKQFFYERDNDY